MPSKVLILRWAGSAYDSLGGILDLVARELAGRGFDVTIFAAGEPDWPNRLWQMLQPPGGFAFALTMSGIGAELTAGNRPIWEAARVPLFNWCCDHPCYFPIRHVIRTPFLLHGYVFPDHARYSIEHLNPNGAAYAVHIGIPPRFLFSGAPLPAEVRNGRIVFSKSGQDTDAIEAKWRSLPAVLQRILFAAAEELMHRNTGDVLPVVGRLAETEGLFIDGASQYAMRLILELDSYIRFRRANLVVQTALRYPVDVFGSGWEHVDWSGARAAYHGPLDWRQMTQRLSAYSGCLSINPLVDDSVHDRVFFALAAGVAPLSDSNAFSCKELPELERYAFAFRPQSIAAAIEAALDDPSAAMDLANQAWRRLASILSLEQSVSRIAELALLHGMNARLG